MMMDAKDYSGVSVKGLHWFAFEQNESTPVPFEVSIDCLIYFVINAQLYF